MPEHFCTQQRQIDALTSSDKRQSLAIFGDPESGEIGMVGELKTIRELLEEMRPTYKELDNWWTFFKKGKDVGLGMAMFITALGVIFGGIYAIKEWINK